MRVPSTFSATLELDAFAYTVTYEYEAPEPDVGLSGGWSPVRFVGQLGAEVDEDEIAARHELPLDALNDLLCELATENEPSLDEAEFGPSYDEECGFDPYLGSYSDDC